MLTAVLCAFVVSGVGGAAVVPPSWADPQRNPCASLPGGWQLLQWPADGQCYRVFSRGPPCPPSMELTPGVGANGGPGCKCPPAWAQDAATAECHELFSRGPCVAGDYWAPRAGAGAGQGQCRSPPSCPEGHVFWARTGACLRRLTRGPCFKGELLVEAEPGSGSALAACRCSSEGELGKHFWPASATCHEHYTAGPCAEPGHLFLPGAVCGCSPNLAQFHAESGRCYQLGTPRRTGRPRPHPVYV